MAAPQGHRDSRKADNREEQTPRAKKQDTNTIHWYVALRVGHQGHGTVQEADQIMSQQLSLDARNCPPPPAPTIGSNRSNAAPFSSGHEPTGPAPVVCSAPMPACQAWTGPPPFVLVRYPEASYLVDSGRVGHETESTPNSS